MGALSALSFANPAALLALLALPLIWWLLRYVPPRPETVRFAPFRLLLDLVAREEDTETTPWWLILLRLALAALVILAVARPLLPDDLVNLAAKTPVLIVVDDGWASGNDWREISATLDGLIDAAGQAQAPVTLATTAPRTQPRDLAAKAAAAVREQAATLAPRALTPDRAKTLVELQAGFADAEALRVFWLSDGLDHGAAKTFAEGLAGLAGDNAQVQVFRRGAGDMQPALATPALAGGVLKAGAVRNAGAAASEVTVELLARNGRRLAEKTLTFKAGETAVSGNIDLPLALRNEAGEIRLAGQRSAGAVYLLDDRWQRKTVTLLTGSSLELAQPLLSPLYYVSRALEPSAEVNELAKAGDLGEAIEAGTSLIVLADVGNLRRGEHDALSGWVNNGGVLLRFAGPRLAGGNDELVPVKLRAGGRALGSALSWEQPQRMAPFADDSPFAGLAIDDSVLVTRQVLAEPDGSLRERVWASLEDGTPLITAQKRGSGLLVLFHVTANGDWSNLPFSGLFVELLRRILDLAPGIGAETTAATTAAQTAGTYVPQRLLDGFGRLGNPSGDAAPIAARDISTAVASAGHPAGLYKQAGSLRAINLALPQDRLTALSDLPGRVATAGYTARGAVSFTGPILALAFALFLADCIAALALSGTWRRLRTGGALGVTLALLASGLSGDPALAQSSGETATSAAEERFALEAVLETRLAYVVTGSRNVDDVSMAGLTGLTQVLRQRTSIEPAAPVGINIETDEIVFFPLLYWPVLADAQPPSPAAIAKIDTFMKNGGTIFFDTQDSQSGLSAITGDASAATQALRRLLASLDIPPLEPVPPEHVLTKAFYLMQSFPGRWAGGDLWVEASGRGNTPAAGNSDGVTAIIIGSNAYAAAWARDFSGRALYPAVPGGERQREFAYRTGVNVVMYALTGNYKADQVHVPALLERLGQ